MPILSTTRTFRDGEVLVEADLDVFLDDIEAFLNTTRINDDNIQNNGITGSLKLLNQSVTEAKLAANAVTTLKIANGAVTEDKIANNAVTTDKIKDDAITSDKLAELSVTTGHIGLEAVQEAQLADNAVTSDKLSSSASVDADRAVTTDHIRNEAVTTAKIANGAVTKAKITAPYIKETLPNISVTTSLPTHAISSNSITTTGRPVIIILLAGSIIATGQNGNYTWGLVEYNGSSYTEIKRVRNGGTGGLTIFTDNLGAAATGSGALQPAVVFSYVPSAGTYRYGITLSRGSPGPASLTAQNVEILAYEL